ncbi:MAG: hypothetical protein ACO3XO_08070 [Bdellovibrionota bacterium]|jgi:hypothetical protein
MSPRKFRSLELVLAGLVLALVMLLGLPVISETSFSAPGISRSEANRLP